MRNVAYLASYDERAKEDTFVGPFFEGDVEMWLGAIEVGQCGEDDGDFHLCALQHVAHAGGEGRALGVPRQRAPAARVGWAAQGVVDRLDDSVDEVF